MRKPGGYAAIIGETLTEFDTFTCFHCQRITHVKPRCDPADLGGLCKVCMKLICERCVGHGCTPFEKKIDEMEERAYRLRQYAAH